MKMERALLLLALPILSLFLVPRASQAIVTAASLSNYTIPYETVGTPTNTTVTYTINQAGDVEISIFRLADISDVPSAANQIAAIQQTGLIAGTYNYTWDGLWLVGGDLGRSNGYFRFIVTVNTGGTTTSFTIPTLLQITSLDIHGVNVTPSMDGNGNPSLPYSIQYDLAKDSLVTVLIKDSNGNVVRNFDNATNTPQFNETIKTNVLTWDGLGNDQRPVPLAVYTVQIDAREPSPGTDVAITRTRTVAIQSLASLGTSPNETFAANTFVYPNPVRNGQATFQFLAVRNNATISMKIYNLAGDLVRDESFPNLATGNLVTFNWDATNESGEKVGRGLYYYVVREEDQEGTLQTIKKFAVIP